MGVGVGVCVGAGGGGLFAGASKQLGAGGAAAPRRHPNPAPSSDYNRGASPTPPTPSRGAPTASSLQYPAHCHVLGRQSGYQHGATRGGPCGPARGSSHRPCPCHHVAAASMAPRDARPLHAHAAVGPGNGVVGPWPGAGPQRAPAPWLCTGPAPRCAAVGAADAARTGGPGPGYPTATTPVEVWSWS
jgi:hypothetical protein